MDVPVRPTLILSGIPGGSVSRRLCGSRNFGRRLISRFHVRHSRRLIEGTPRRRVCDLADVTRATVVGRVVEVAGDGPAVKTWREGGAEGENKKASQLWVGRLGRSPSATKQEPFAFACRRTGISSPPTGMGPSAGVTRQSSSTVVTQYPLRGTSSAGEGQTDS
ncbi:hypothetical protein [Haloferax mediterranei]|uniref:hypothetical protein n=1 Tax=Haloferax mediterranei TaxID=2252 RepID=UPI0018CC4AC6|nr:hypothetical protein [Haloferax mediterranei]